MSHESTIAILGSGSWGSTIAAMLHRAGHTARVWSHSADELDILRRTGHPPGVPELRLPPEIPLSTSLAETLSGVDAAVFVTPAQAMTSVCLRIRAEAAPPPIAIIASKGIDLETLRPLSVIIAQHLPETIVTVLSGPCIAREVAQGIPTSVVAASTNEAAAQRVQQWFASPTFRVYTQPDVIGVEYAAAYKNVIAIAAGIGDGLGFGANTKSAVLTRGLAEMRRFVLEMGARELTIMGLAGLGDLCVTCFSPHSRNRRFGEALGHGAKPIEAIAEIGEIVEGVPTARAITRIAAQRNLTTPIADTVAHIVDGHLSPREAVTKLMTRELKGEF